MYFNQSEVGMTVPLTILSADNGDFSGDTRYVVRTTALWESLRSNRSSVFLHVILARHGPLEQLSISSMKTGDILFGSVELVKFDFIPKSFHHRFLLTDLGLVSMTPSECW